MMNGLREVGDEFGSYLMTKQVLEVYQVLPFAWAALTIKELSTMLKEAGNAAMPQNYMGITFVCFKLCEEVETRSVNFSVGLQG